MEKSPTTTIYSLPDEIIIMILKRTSYADCNSFRRTCKRYNDLVKYCHSLWRVIYLQTVGKVIFNITASESTGDWLNDLKQYLCLKHTLIDIIAEMSPNHFREYNVEISLDSCKNIFGIALSSNTYYYFTITILQNFVQEASRRVNTFETKKPYTLTEIHYGKIFVRNLIHVLYSLKWVHHYCTSQLTPEIVLNFFTQWVDPVHMHRDEEVLDLIKDMVKDVDQLLLETSDSNRLPGVETIKACASGIYTEKQVLLAISHYMYKRRCMVLIAACNQDTLDITKTIKSNSGHGACLGSIFQAIARGFGITSCTLISFPNHLYLEWRVNRGFDTDTMQFSLENGDLRRRGRCPFSGHDNQMNRFNYTYSAESFMQYIITAFLRHLGDNKNWHTINAVHLMDLLRNSRGSRYSNFIQYLSAQDRNRLRRPLNIENIDDDHRSFIYALLHLNKTRTTCYRDVAIKPHSSSVQYCVGMICHHKVLDYVCIIRGWDYNCAPDYCGQRPEAGTLEFGLGQPFYQITALDQSDRYVAQEHLTLVPNPSRIYHLEDAIGKEFTHFNGFFYEPNAEKQIQYPGSMDVGKMYADRYLARVMVPRERY